MRLLALVFGIVLAGEAAIASTPLSVLKRSDVVFMYQADRATYEAYDATVVAWGGTPNARSRAEAAGLKFFGSVGMVTEFARYHRRFPDTYEQGLCRDIEGRPVKVPWLTDHQHQGIPYWWCCTAQPLFREFIRERVVETVRAGADGVHIDDHLGTAGGLWLGICFCERCVNGFRSYLATLPAEELRRHQIENPGTFDYRLAVRRWLTEDLQGKRRPTEHPLWDHWTIYQCRAQASFLQELRELAAQTAGRPVPLGANAGLLWPRHLSDHHTLDLFSAETDHEAAARRFSDRPLFAYRLADAVGRPYASTASGHDWAFIKEHSLPGLVRGWIALGYAAGHNFMAPHRQWCYTPEKGTHWYEGPAEKFAPLYRFVRRTAWLFDEFENHADLAVLLPHRAFARDPGRWFQLAETLAATNVSFRLLLAGDEIVNHPLRAEDFASDVPVLAPDRESLLPADRELLERHAARHRVLGTVAEALARVRPAVRVSAAGSVRALARTRPGAAVVHLLNYEYRPEHDDVAPLADVRVRLDLKALGVPGTTSCRYWEPDARPQNLPMADGTVTVPSLGLWGLLEVTAARGE